MGDEVGALPAHAAAGGGRGARGVEPGGRPEPGGGGGGRAPAAAQPGRRRGRAPRGRTHRRPAAGAAARPRRARYCLYYELIVFRERSTPPIYIVTKTVSVSNYSSLSTIPAIPRT